MSNTTTLATGWKVTRADGAVIGATDCDHDVIVGGVTYVASTGFHPSDAVSSLGLGVDDQEIQGALSSAAITEADLADGIYDDARVEVIEIDWSGQTETDVIGHFYIGEVSRTETAFTAELRSESGILSKSRGRRTLMPCDAELGEPRCGVNPAAFTQAGSVTGATGDADFLVTGLTPPEDGFFGGGLLTWITGDNAGQVSEVRVQLGANMGIWAPPLSEIQAGDTFTIVPGCDKTFDTCRARFSNGVNFRGFPAIVGDDAFTYVTPGDAGLDGGAMNDF